MIKKVVVLLLSLNMTLACTHITVNRGADKVAPPTSEQSRKVNFLLWMFLSMQKAPSATEVCFPGVAESFTIGMDAFDWLLSIGTGGFYVQQTVNYRCSPAPETKKVSKNQ